MQVGELFFSLGFKSSGTGEAAAFSSAIDTSSGAIEVLSSAMDHLIYLLEEMAVKMGAVSRGDLEASKQLIHEEKIEKLGKSALLVKTKDTKATKENTEAERRGNQEKKNKVGLLTVLHGKLGEYIGKMNAVRVEALAMAGGLSYFVNKASQAARELDKISALTGYSQVDMQRLGDMASQTGGNINDITGAVQNFQKQSLDIALGRGGNIGAYNLLGLNPHDDPMVLLDKIGRKLKTLPAAYGANLARDLGLSDDLIYMLKNMENIKPIPKETLLSEDELKRLKNFNFYFNRVFEQGKRTLMKFAAFLSPVVSELVYLMDRITMLASKGLSAIEPYMKKLEPFIPMLKMIGIALFAAIFPATAAFLFLMVVLEDIGSYLNGDKSVFGLMIEQLGDVKTRTEDMTAAWATLMDMLTFGTISKDKIFEMAQNKMKNAEIRGMSQEDYKRYGMMAGNAANQFNPTMQDILDIKNRLEMQKAGYSEAGAPVVNQNITVQGNMDKDAAKELKDVSGIDFKKLGTAHINFGAPEAGGALP